MKRSLKLTLGISALALAALTISGCTTSFCSTIETARMMYAYEPGVSEYHSYEDIQSFVSTELQYVEKVFNDNDDLYRIVYRNEEGAYLTSATLSSILATAKSNSLYIPSREYFTMFDTKVLELAISIYNNDVNAYENAIDDNQSAPLADVRSIKDENGQIVEYLPVSTSDITRDETNALLKQYGYLKFYGTDELLWVNYEVIDAEVKKVVGLENSPDQDFSKLYVSQMTTTVSSLRSCIATISGEYGSYGYNGESILIDAKSWEYAWSKGPIEGLLVYPVAYLLDTITVSMGGVSANGWIQLAALAIVTFIVRTFILLVTFWSTVSQQKMQALQPEIAKIQAKYPNAQTNQSEKMRLSQETAALYKKNKVNPLMSILVMVIQFPIFIGVWGAMNGSAVLSTGTLLNLQLSTSIWTAFSNFGTDWATNAYGFWTALVIFLIMAGTQFISMKLPQWLTVKKSKNVSRLTKNPSQDQQAKTMKIVSWVMLAMIVFMGVTLPAAMAIYWIFGAIYSVIQTLVIQLLVVPALMKREKRKK